MNLSVSSRTELKSLIQHSPHKKPYAVYSTPSSLTLCSECNRHIILTSLAPMPQFICGFSFYHFEYPQLRLNIFHSKQPFRLRTTKYIISEITHFFRKHSVKPDPLCIINTLLHILQIQKGVKHKLYTFSNNSFSFVPAEHKRKTTIDRLFEVMPQLLLFHAFNMVFNEIK